MAEPLDPDAAERVLRRAGDIADEDSEHEYDPVDGIEPAAIISAAVEVGIPERAVRRSLAIEQLGPPPTVGRLDSVAGPAMVVEQRVVAASPDEVLDRLDRWLVGAHHLRRERRRPGSMEWRHRDDVVGGLHRTVRGLAGEGRLGHVRWVHAAATAVDVDETVVRVTIDRSAHRRASLAGGATLGAGAATFGVVGLVLTAPIAIAALPAGVAGAFVLSSGRNQARRFDRELQWVLDAVEEARVPSSRLRGIRRRFVPRRSA